MLEKLILKYNLARKAASGIKKKSNIRFLPKFSLQQISLLDQLMRICWSKYTSMYLCDCEYIPQEAEWDSYFVMSHTLLTQKRYCLYIKQAPPKKVWGS